MNLQEARKKGCRIAMADLLGYSEPPEGGSDQYPFNAVAFVKTLPKMWQERVHDDVVFVYHHEEFPPDVS